MKDILNDAYYNGTKISYYTSNAADGYAEETSEDFSNNHLSVESKKLFDNVIWNLGGTSDKYIAKKIYEEEHSSNVYSGNSPVWTGKIALTSASDYGFANSNQDCRNNKEGYEDNCNATNWLFKQGSWLLTATASNSYEIAHFGFNFFYCSGDSPMDVYPSLYLKSSVKITSGTGTPEDPYQLSL